MASAASTNPATLGKNPERSRDHNRRVVLDVVRRNGPVGRMEIARQSQLTAQAIANIVDELVADGLLMAAGRLRIGRGQPPIQFSVKPDGAMTIGIEVAADHANIAVLDLAGQARATRTRNDFGADPQSVATLLNDELARFGRDFSGRLLGVGVVMPGPFLTEGLTSVGPTTLPDWSGVDPAEYLSQACGQQVTVENDATAAAMGERLFGAGANLSRFGMIYFGAGIGLGIVNEGWPLRGAFGNAGEIGSIPVAPRGAGRPVGDLDRHASLYALRQKLQDAGLDDIGLDQLAALHGGANAVVMTWLDEAADYLSPTVAMIENILDPETIVIGGALPDAMLADLIARLTPLPVSVASRRVRNLPRVIAGQTGSFTAALGAAALPLYSAVTPKLQTQGMEDAAWRT